MTEGRDRLAFLGFTDSDARLLAALKPWAEGMVRGFAREFYQRTYGNPNFNTAFSNPEAIREKLEEVHAQHCLDLFGGWPDAVYLRDRQRLGRIYADLNVAPAWLIISYQVYYDYLYPAVGRKLQMCPRSSEQALGALNKLLIFDRCIILDTYAKAVAERLRGSAG
ncbi:MAG: protoglobin domain-containing protein [Dehalococcoidia bacterium]